jgi:hypothetical protein
VDESKMNREYIVDVVFESEWNAIDKETLDIETKQSNVETFLNSQISYLRYLWKIRHISSSKMITNIFSYEGVLYKYMCRLNKRKFIYGNKKEYDYLMEDIRGHIQNV